jgi:eukaryotic-like serine/threonine-protein kinase
MSEQIGRVLDGRYRLVAPIGTGASATVYLADDVRLRRRVAVKILHPQLAGDEQFLRRFQAEAQAAAALNDPHVMAVYDWGRDEVPYLVTEYLGGGSLRGVLDTGERLTLSQALLVGLQATRGLEYAHRRGFVHRDIKPANLLFGDDERLRIADFGLARALAEAGWTEPGTMLGTVRYASPEQAKGGQVEPKSDVYSLGLTLIEAVSGEVPFAADTTIATLMARVDTQVELDREQFGPLRPVLERACRPDPSDRPDAGELAVSFMAAAESLPRPTPIPLAGALVAGAAGVEAEVDITNMVPVLDDEDDAFAVAAGAARPSTTRTPDADPAPSKRQQRKAARAQAREGRRRRRWPWALAALVVVLAAAAGTVFALNAMQTPTHEVEDFSGLFETDVRSLVEEYGWSIEVNSARQTGSDVGTVLRQEPEPGVLLEEGSESLIRIWVSIGNDLVTVPEGLAGVPRDEAVTRLAEVDLGVGVETPEPNEDVPEGHVIRVEHTEPLAEGDSVDLVISSGPMPRTVPEVPLEASYEQMAERIESLGLVPERGESSSRSIAEGDVIRLEPATGELVERGSTVVVVVSTGLPMIAVPDVAGLTEASASQALADAGFEVGSRDGPARRLVRGTDPPAGTMLREGATVNIITR